MMIRRTEFSPCRLYRYTLWREWDDCGPLFTPKSIARSCEYLMVIGLNPSTADETKDDPTIRRCIGFAKKWGFGALCMTNLFAWRDTDPEKMKASVEPVGIENDQWLETCAKNAGMILAAWGNHGAYIGRDKCVRGFLPPLLCLGTNKDGSPKHPLYVKGDTVPTLLP
jgi:hypothetical protein